MSTLRQYRRWVSSGRTCHWKWAVPGYLWFSVYRDEFRTLGLSRFLSNDWHRTKLYLSIRPGRFLRGWLLEYPVYLVRAKLIPRLIRFLAKHEAYVPGVGRYRDEIIRRYDRSTDSLYRMLKRGL